jgi:hypothetical protein
MTTTRRINQCYMYSQYRHQRMFPIDILISYIIKSRLCHNKNGRIFKLYCLLLKFSDYWFLMYLAT